MKILKYIFLLLLLCFVSFSVFLATQKGNFSVERSMLIHSKRTTVYNFVNEYRNWGSFVYFLTNNPNVQINFPKNTTGKGGSCYWNGNKIEGKAETIAAQINDSIAQKIINNGTEYIVVWKFKDTLGGTKVSWQSKGRLSFSDKIYATLHGGVNRTLGIEIEKTLANLDQSVDYEINTFSIKVNGLVSKFATPYLHQTFTTKISNVQKNSQIVFPKIITFCQKNAIEMNGKPFILFHTYDLQKGIAKISCCIPIKNSIFTSEGSDIMATKLPSFVAVKTTLRGDYSHTKKALEKTKTYFATNKITADTKFSHIEIYSISEREIKKPSLWKTEFFFPVKPKIVAPKKPKKTIQIPVEEPVETTQTI